MSKHYRSTFNTRQIMENKDFEIFYYEDKELSPVSMHQHDFYEVYFFIGGNVGIALDKQEYTMSYGSICIIPPHIHHRPIFYNDSVPYRRIVLWISPLYLNKLIKLYDDIFYCFHYVSDNRRYHYQTDFGSAQLLYSKLINIIEETHANTSFQASLLDNCISSFLLYLNRFIYNTVNHSEYDDQASLFTHICNYITSHLDGDLTLDAISSHFHVSKYYVSHMFKQSMGLSTHQYILKKRLNASKNDIHSGIALQTICISYGFKDYTTFYRAFKKEFGMSPREYKESYNKPVLREPEY